MLEGRVAEDFLTPMDSIYRKTEIDFVPVLMSVINVFCVYNVYYVLINYGNEKISKREQMQ